MPSIAEAVRVHPATEVHARPAAMAGSAVQHLGEHAPWWLHIDLDVLEGKEFPACGAAKDPNMPGGLTWGELAAVVEVALQSDHCHGMSLGVYNTDLDPSGEAARSIVRFLARIA